MERNVKRTFFDSYYGQPCYELENGTILKPYVLHMGFKDKVVWMESEEAFNELLKQLNAERAGRKWYQLWK